jgi:hypothetical protein
MRLLQLNPDGTEESALDFHPLITVVNGLGVEGREAVIRAVTAIAQGKDPGIGGLIEAHGIMLDLTADVLGLLDLHTDVDVLVRRDEIPAPDGQAAAPAASAPKMSVEEFLATTAPGSNADLDKARKGLSDAAEALAVLRDAATRSGDEHRIALRHREEAEAALDRARETRAAASGAAAVEHVGELSAEEVGARRAELEGLVDELRAELTRIDRGLDELTAIDVRPVQVLLDAIRNPAEAGDAEYVSSERAIELADEFVKLQAAVSELEAKLEGSGRGPASAMQQLEEARAELQQAERRVSKPNLSPEETGELEKAHEAVLDAERKASGRFGRGKRLLDEALAREQEILDRVGFPTWSAYVMGANLLGIDPAAEERLEAAQHKLELAETNWAQITEMIEADPEHRALLDRLEAVHLEAFDLLGGEEPDDLEAALRDHKEVKREVSVEDLVDALSYQLELVGLHLGDSPSLDRTVVVADAFLAEAGGINERIAELEAERRAATDAMAAVQLQLDKLPSKAEVASGAADALTFASNEPDVSDDELVHLEQALAEAAEVERETAEQLEAREALVDAATQVHAVATSRLMKIAGELAEQEYGNAVPAARSPSEFQIPVDVEDDNEQDAIEFYLLARLAALRNVSFAGSVPLVVDDALAAAPPSELHDLLLKLERMADAVQIIYLTDDPTVTNWAIEAGFQRAAVVEAPAPFAA